MNLLKKIQTTSYPIRIATAAVVGVAAVIALAAALGTFSATPSRRPVTYVNISRDYRVCLVSTTRNRAATDPIWQAVSAAKAKVALNAQQTIAPAGSTKELIPYLNGVVNLKCGLVITSGSDLHDALTAIARTTPQQKYLNIGSNTDAPNVRDLSQPTDTSQIIDLIETAARTQYGGTTAPPTPHTAPRP